MFSNKSFCWIKNKLEQSSVSVDNCYLTIARNSKVKKLLSALFLLFVFFVIFFLNRYSIFQGDDYAYSFVFSTSERISGLSDIVHSQLIHYKLWGGRTVVHSILQLLLMGSPLTIDIINSLAFVLLVVVMYYHAKGRSEHSFSLLGGMFFLVWILQPVFADTVLWVTGSVNYLWGTVIILLFLLPYRLYQGKERKGAAFIFQTAIFFLLGIVAGWTNENTAVAMIAMILLFLLSYKVNNIKIPAWAIAGLAGGIIGFVMMIVAPGNFARAEGASPSALKIVYNLLTSTQFFVYYLGALNLIMIIFLVIYHRISLSGKRQLFLYVAIYMVGVLGAIYSMTFSPAFPPRAWFGAICLNIIAAGIAYKHLLSDKKLVRQIKTAITVYIFLMFGFSFYDAAKDVTTLANERGDREAFIATQKEKGEKKVVLKKAYPKTKFGLIDATYGVKFMSEYYGIEIEFAD
ncbi:MULTISPECIES: DUF6056 family protein [unclassified Dysgonomonas]|uniref:DUF3329 domain-containing protein n=1 Tax=unclassified Dysgonomonas TaxID=2630389 RepID=UPI0024750D9A|nr:MULTISPECIES: DUF6056 family protein [unclassified Dysgonomonas]